MRISDLLAGSTFSIMGALTLYWASMNQVAVHSMLQIDINIYLTQLNNSMNRFIGWMPQYAWAILFIGLFACLVILAVRQFRKN